MVEISGDRREFFEPELGLRRLASGLLREKIQPLAFDTRNSLVRLRHHTANAPSAQRDFQLDRIRQLEVWHRQLGRLLPMIQAILKVSRR